MADYPGPPTPHEIQSEVDLYQTLLKSLEVTSEDGEITRREFQRKIDELKSLLAILRGDDEGAHRPGAERGGRRDACVMTWPPISLPYAHSGTDGAAQLDRGLDGVGANAWTAQATDVAPVASARPATVPAFQTSPGFGFTQSPTGGAVGTPWTKKRPRESTGSYGNLCLRDGKSTRMTPSPQVTDPTTPSSFSSFDMSPEDLDVARALLGDHPDTTPTDFLRMMRENEKMARERFEQERQDAEYARTLQGNISPVPYRAAPEIQGSRGPRPSQPFPASEPLQPAAIDFNQSAERSGARWPSLTGHSTNVGPFAGPLARDSASSYCPMPGAFVDLDTDEEEEVREIQPPAPPTQYSGQRTNPDLPYFDNVPLPIDLNRCIDVCDFDFSGNATASTGSMLSNPSMISSWPQYHQPSHIPIHPQPVQEGSANTERLGEGSEDTSDNLFAYPPSTPFDDHLMTASNMILPGGGTNWTLPNSDYGLSSLCGLFDFPSGQSPNGANADPFPTASAAAYYDYVTNDPRKTREEIKSLLENIRPDVELPPENREGTPEAMKYPLMEHQKLGLTWLKNMEDGSNKGGILADDMGLGKTIQALALLVSRPSEDPHRKTTLIVAPVALLRQWEREIATKIKRSHRLRTVVLHGSQRNAKWATLRQCDVVLTTFGTLASELKKKEDWEWKRRADPEMSSGLAPNLPLLGEDSKWYRVIIDEAQCIKNRTTKAAMGACALQARIRFCLTGTPMMNSVAELHSLIEFLRIKPYNEAKRFNQDFTIPLKRHHQTSRDQAMRKLQALLKAVLLRRTKKSTIDGKPIIELQPRTDEVQHAIFDEDQQAFYAALESQSQLQFNKYLRQDSIGRNYSNVLVLLLRLRQACCHPHLIRDFAQESVNAGLSPSDMMELAKELAPEVVARIKEVEAFECPVCYDAVENPAIFLPCGHDTCSECFAKISDQSGAQGLAQGQEHADVKCPQCRGKISVRRIIDYTTFKKVHIDPDETVSDAVALDGGENVDDTDSEDDGDDSTSETDDLDGFVVHTDEDTDMEHGTGANPFEKAQKGDHKKHSGDESVPPGRRQKRKRDRKGKGKAKEPTKSLAQLKREGLRNAKARRAYMRRLRKDWVPSAKVDRCCEILERIQSDPSGEKTIVFSQFTSLLDLLEVPISRNKWGFTRYDGSMTASQRNDAVLEFSDPENRNCRIMLVSLKAGNAGLNLVAASQVIILDPFWNPFIEEQAIDRTHRIGQQRPVKVHRILVAETIEDRIIALQEKKRKLIDGALDEKASQSIGRLGIQELSFLFGVGGA